MFACDFCSLNDRMKRKKSMKKAILLVSVGSTHLDVLERTTGALVEKIREAFPGQEVHQAFSSSRILKMMQEKKTGEFKNVREKLDELEKGGYSCVTMQPVYVISGQEQENVREIWREYQDRFEKITLGKPLFSAKEDYIKALEGILMEAALEEGEALMLVGHGTNHHTNTEYQNLEYTAYVQGHRNIFVAALEGHQKLAILMRKLQISGCKKICLMPLLYTAGKHAQKDIGGSENSWKIRLEEAGYEVRVNLKGLGEIEQIQKIYLEHLTQMEP